MANPQRTPGTAISSKAETAAAVEAIGRLHHMLSAISDSLALARNTGRTLLNHAHALPGGVPRQAAVAFARLRLEVAHQDALSLETLCSIVESIPVPEVRLSTVSTTPRVQAVDDADRTGAKGPPGDLRVSPAVIDGCSRR